MYPLERVRTLLLHRLEWDSETPRRKSECEAQAEAKLRAQKNRDRRRYIHCISTSSAVEDYDPPILIYLNVNGHKLLALVDSGADVNVISYGAYSKLQCGYQITSTKLTSYANEDTEPLGITSLCLKHANFQDKSQFYVAQKDQSNHDFDLGQSLAA